MSTNINQDFSVYNENLEQELLGYLIIDSSYMEDLSSLKEDHFYFEKNKAIFKEILNMVDKNEEINEVSLFYKLEKKKTIYETTDALRAYIKFLVDSAVASLSSVSLIEKILINLSLKRKLNQIKSNISEYLHQEDDVNVVFSKLEADIYQFASSSSKNEPRLIGSISSALMDSLKMKIKNPHLKNSVDTGFADIDKHFGGFHNSDLIILAARPSMGKTALAVNIATKVAVNFLKSSSKKSVLFFSLEMSSEQISARIISSEVNLPVKTIINAIKDNNERIKDTSDPEFISIISAIEGLQDMPIFIDDTGGISISEIRKKARILKRKHNLGIIFIDYLQLIQSSKYTNNRILEISDITQNLKSLAKELNVPVIALSQLSRAVESSDRKDKRPKLSDLRESGSIEQDADIVTFLYREAYYLEREVKVNLKEEESSISSSQIKDAEEQLRLVKNQADLIIAKNRNGSIGTISLFYDPARMCFGNLASGADSAASRRKAFASKKAEAIGHSGGNQNFTEEEVGSSKEMEFLKALKEKM